ncbi:MAG: hypothetical protein WBP12_02810 [Candidatus Saccharimonas sp.]
MSQSTFAWPSSFIGQFTAIVGSEDDTLRLFHENDMAAIAGMGDILIAKTRVLMEAIELSGVRLQELVLKVDFSLGHPCAMLASSQLSPELCSRLEELRELSKLYDEAGRFLSKWWDANGKSYDSF